jgi:M6 family metalloprotease-like protein
MKFFISLFFFIVSINLSYAQTGLGFECGQQDSPPGKVMQQTGSLFKPAINSPGQQFRVLFVFVQFQGDTRTNTAWPLNQLPTWADDFIDSSPSSSYRDLTLSDYWKEMSMGNYDFVGDVYPNLVILPPESQYLSQGRNYAHANQDVLDLIDENVDFNDYDKWSYNYTTQSFQYAPDGFVDMIYFVYRDPNGEQWFGDFSAIANLSSTSYDYVTDDTYDTDFVKLRARYCPTKESTAITVRVGLSGHLNLLGIFTHEFGHYIFGCVHWNYGGIMGGGTYAMNGWERERVGYIAQTDVTGDNFTMTLGDFIEDGDMLRIPITSQNYFLVENHQRQSHYDQIIRGGAIGGAFNFTTTLGSGIYIWKVSSGSTSNPSFEIVTADGRFDWVYDGDFYAPGFHHLSNCPNYVPKTKRTAVSRHTGKNDRMPLHIEWCGLTGIHAASKWCDVDGYNNYWLSRDVMGDETDAFNLDYIEIFSPWSNPSSYHGGTTNLALQVFSKNGNNITVKAFTNSTSAQNLPPSKPQLLEVEASQNYHPYLTWEANLEPDINKYKIYKYVTYVNDWQYLAQTTNNYYEDGTENVCTAIPPAQCEAGHYIRYRVTAIDNQQLESVPSDSVMINVNGYNPEKRNFGNTSDVKPSEYSLAQNYPNPFNPSTIISYSIKKAGFVSLKVYDVLGKEVAVLVSENESAGSYSVEFNAVNLSSGIYFYTLTSGDFTDSKKLMLLK